jgi:Na+/H+ antiporter NhaD/arsenite permease-like protein
VGLILVSGVWQPGVVGKVGSTELQGQNVLRDLGMVVLALASFWLTAKRNRAANDFSWRPIVEVAKIFAGIFVCIVPVAAALQAGAAGSFAPLLALVSQPDGTPNPAAYFWATGLLSSVLDNAPTYLVFFDLAGGAPGRLMGPLAATLAAISTGAVFMGANTYIGNAPNYMVYAIARSAGVKMPGFIGYMAWSGAILIPIFVLVTLLFFR